MGNMIGNIYLSTCTFCRGRGHQAKQCAFKKNIDDAFKNAPLMRKIWGAEKSFKKVNGAQKAQKTKATVDITTLEVEFGKAVAKRLKIEENLNGG